MSTTAFTASVWGQGRAAVALSAQVAHKIKEGDEECHICRDDIPATIAFVPCKHKVCFGCVENMRAKNIFKADKGIKCPFCRQYVDGYRSILAPNPEVQKFLLEANKAANIAAQARAVAERRAQGLQPQAAPAAGTSAAAAGGSSSRPHSAGSAAAAAAAEDQTWNCGSCGGQNYMWREFCGRCKRPNPNPYASDKLSQTRRDLSVVGRDELVTYLREQGGYSLRKGLRDMGISLDGTKSYGSVKCIREAVAMFGLKKRVLRIAGLLADPDALRDASLDKLGNLGVQRVLESMAKLRQAYPSDKPHPDIEEFKKEHGGKDPFGALLAAMKSRMLEFCMHEKGVYVVQCAANLTNNSELVEMAQTVFPLALPVSRDPRGVFVLLSLLDLFSQRIWEDEQNCEPALKAVDYLCAQFTVSDKQLLYTAHHALSGKVIVRAIAVCMPRLPALRLAVRVATHAAALSGSPGGLMTLMELLQLYGHNQQAAEGLRDVVCMMSYSLMGHINKLSVGGDENTAELLLCLIERLGHEQEIGWLDSIAQELVAVCDALNESGMEVLKFTLTQPCMDLDAITTHIKDMKAVLGKHALVPIAADIMERVASNPPPAAPKHAAASIIQPELKYYLDQGWPTPLPPPPPPQPGEPGCEEYAAQAAARAEAQAKAAAEARAAKEALAKARSDAAAAARSAAASSSNASGSGAAAAAAAADAWGSIRAAADGGGGGGANAWGSQAPASSNSSRVAANGSSSAAVDAWGAVKASGAGGTDDANPWSMVLSSTQTNNASWGDIVDDAEEEEQTAAVAAFNPAAAAVPSIPVAVPIAVPVAVPTPMPATVAVASAVPAAVQQPRPYVPAAVPVAVPMQPPPAAAAAARALPPLAPRPAAGAGVAVADFNQAAPARLTPAATPAFPMPQPQPRQQQQQQYATRPDSAGTLGQQQQLQQQQRPRPSSAPEWRPPEAQFPQLGQQQQQQQHHAAWSCSVCTYEHSGVEADFLFCAMCSTQRPQAA